MTLSLITSTQSCSLDERTLRYRYDTAVPKKVGRTSKDRYRYYNGCEVQCPMTPCKERYNRGLEDTTRKEDSEFLKVMDSIHEKVIQIAKSSRYLKVF